MGKPGENEVEINSKKHIKKEFIRFSESLLYTARWFMTIGISLFLQLILLDASYSEEC